VEAAVINIQLILISPVVKLVEIFIPVFPVDVVFNVFVYEYT